MMNNESEKRFELTPMISCWHMTSSSASPHLQRLNCLVHAWNLEIFRLAKFYSIFCSTLMSLPVADINHAVVHGKGSAMCCPQEDHATAALDRTKRNGIPVTESGLDVMQGYPIVGCVPVE